MPVFALRANTDINAATANRPGESAFVSRLGRSQPKFLGLTFHETKNPADALEATGWVYVGRNALGIRTRSLRRLLQFAR